MHVRFVTVLAFCWLWTAGNISSQETAPPKRIYENRLTRIERPQPLLADYPEFFATLAKKTEQYKGKMRVYYHEMGLLDELRYRLINPAALFIILPNGKVKLINALPFTCGDLRLQTLGQVWAQFQKAWQSPRVSAFIDRLAEDPNIVSRLHQWEEVGAA